MNFKEYMLSEDEVKQDFVDPSTEVFDITPSPELFSIAGKLIDSLENSPNDITELTFNLIGGLVDNIIDILLSLENTDMSPESEELFLDTLEALGVTDDDPDDSPEIADVDDDGLDEGLMVKSRKVKAGKKKSISSRLKGARKSKYLKALRARRMAYKKSAMLKKKAKLMRKKYKKTSHAKLVKKKYKAAHRR